MHLTTQLGVADFVRLVATAVGLECTAAKLPWLPSDWNVVRVGFGFFLAVLPSVKLLEIVRDSVPAGDLLASACCRGGSVGAALSCLLFGDSLLLSGCAACGLLCGRLLLRGCLLCGKVFGGDPLCFASLRAVLEVSEGVSEEGNHVCSVLDGESDDPKLGDVGCGIGSLIGAFIGARH